MVVTKKKKKKEEWLSLTVPADQIPQCHPLD